MLKMKKGFTLIELLVVIAIVSLLASVVLASLTDARGKGKDAAIKEEISQLVNLAELNYNDYGDYCNLQEGDWIGTDNLCSDAFANPDPITSKHTTQARLICTNIYNNARDLNYGTSPGSYILYLGTPFGPSVCAKDYSFTAPLNNGKWFCSGSSGKGEYTDVDFDGNDPGCYLNP
ncbi:hypothetical protein A2738_02040 [Candidatus Nomurabacteria bacterium RIFCSPHIGHO2_01_FULL_42_15]|uniref:Type II secretion system protein GspG C-terminal domain-containing protein n=1 Tax=Candidatus Nomurabacteria bacterium RIFCSPHIGHO2_01_FULL_42_15 TaxID=1801742 RepID=A0A1F6VF83_9BACT|nr:MAG: hypothetical protein A2738_02040 [Candidatus Nomurabacteria bacterium RIFCSPHIGHO2_01_FULL_42_15]OGI93387.1 MAG: hypothetical protein A3A99_01770 [Candidatus Nomurabacteria bacterium RIFCSPLOWO2_01_FULL_41_18]